MVAPLHKDFRHPLFQAFGLAAKTIRKDAGMSVKEVSIRLGVGDSLYRLIESGFAVLQPGKSLEFIRAFPDAQLDFNRLSTLLVVIQIIVSSKASTISEAEAQCDYVLAADDQLKLILPNLRSVWQELRKKNDFRVIAKELDRQGLPQQILAFLSDGDSARILTDSDGVKTADVKTISDMFTNTPPMFIDVAASLLESLSKCAPFMNVKAVTQWESSHKSRLRSVTSFCYSLSDTLKSFDEFGWDFLGEPGFLCVHFIVCSEGKAGRMKERSNLEVLKKAITSKTTIDLKRPLEELITLQFVEENDLLREIEAEFIDSENGLTGTHTWLYELSLDDKHSNFYHVALMDNRAVTDAKSNGAYDCIHCSWKSTQRWVALKKKAIS